MQHGFSRKGADGRGSEFPCAFFEQDQTNEEQMKQKTIGLLATAGIWISAAACQLEAAAIFLNSDVSQWYGAAAGAGVSEAVLVIQWPGEINAFAWGYRWDSSQTKTGADLLADLAALSNGQFEVDGLGGGFVSDIRWQGRSFPGFNPGTGEYLQYFVNNEQQPGNFNDGAAPGGAGTRGGLARGVAGPTCVSGCAGAAAVGLRAAARRHLPRRR